MEKIKYQINLFDESYIGLEAWLGSFGNFGHKMSSVVGCDCISMSEMYV